MAGAGLDAKREAPMTSSSAGGVAGAGLDAKREAPPVVSASREDSRGGTRTRDPSIMSAVL